MTKELQYFKPSEFREWWPLMSPKLLNVLDNFREEWGAPCVVSPAEGALGRKLDQGVMSQHNVNQWGEVRAADIFPAGMNTPEDCARAFECAKSAGATGIGIYTDTKPGNMLHLDVREDRTADNPATWSRVMKDGQRQYLGLFAVMPKGWPNG